MVTIFVNESKNKVTAINIITQAYICKRIRHTARSTYLVYGLEGPNQKSLEVQGTTLLKGDVQGRELVHLGHIDIFIKYQTENGQSRVDS